MHPRTNYLEMRLRRPTGISYISGYNLNPFGYSRHRNLLLASTMPHITQETCQVFLSTLGLVNFADRFCRHLAGVTNSRMITCDRVLHPCRLLVRLEPAIQDVLANIQILRVSRFFLFFPFFSDTHDTSSKSNWWLTTILPS